MGGVDVGNNKDVIPPPAELKITISENGYQPGWSVSKVMTPIGRQYACATTGMGEVLKLEQIEAV